MLGLGLGLHKINNFLANSVPFLSDLVQYIKNGVDQIGKESREEVGAWYLEGDGTRYIETDIIPQQLTEFKVYGGFTAFGATERIGVRESFQVNEFEFGINAIGNWTFGFGNFFYDTIAGDVDKHLFEVHDGEFFIDGIKIYGISGSDIGIQTRPIYINALNNDGTASFISNFNCEWFSINGLEFNFEEGNQDNKVYGINRETGETVTGTIQNATGADRVQTFDYRLDRDMDFNGFTEADGVTYYEDEALTTLVPQGKRSPNFNGKTVWYTEDSVPNNAPSANKGELKADVTTVIGTSTEQDTTKNTVVEATLPLTTQHYDMADIDNPVPINRAITAEYLNDSNRYFTSDFLATQLLYNRELTTEEVAKVESFLGI